MTTNMQELNEAMASVGLQPQEINPNNDNKLTADDGRFYSNKDLFANTAPRYWAVGMPVIPLRPRSKMPIPLSWQHYSERMPTPQEQSHWLNNLPDSNIGLPLGPQSGCIAIDIDTPNEDLIQLIQRVCGYSPWERIGKKGKVLMYKFNGQKPFKIKDVDGHMICECLSSRNQVVLPPSIHPDTQRPYACNVDLAGCFQRLQPLPQDIETLLRTALTDAGVRLSHSGWTRTTDYVSQGSRDVKMTAMSGFLAAGVTRGELTLVEAIERMRAWKSMCVENVAGDDIDIEKGVRNLIQFLIQDVTGPKNRPLPIGWDEGLTPEQKKSWGLEFAEDHTEWSVTQILAYLQAEFGRHEEEGSIQRVAAIDYALRKIERSPSLSSLDTDMVYNYIIKTNKNTVNKSTLKNRLKELKQNKLEGKDHTELAKATIEELERYGELRFSQDNFWQWKGSNWEILSKWNILKTIANTFGNLPAAKKSSDHWGIYNVMKSLVPQDGLDTLRIHGVNFANCFVDEEGVTHEHNKGYGCTYTLPFRYMPELANNHPQFDKFLYSVWGNCKDFTQRVQALREVMCATFLGTGTSFARAVLLYGIAGSGKSQLLEIIKHLMPDNVVTYVTPYEFSDRFLKAELAKSLLNICGELKENEPIPGAAFKSVVDGSSLQGQFKYGTPFPFSPVATHWFASNYLPKTRDVTEGFNRRWLVFSFDHPVRKEDKVRDIGNLIAAEERESIVAWVLGCAKELSTKGDYTIPQSHKEIMKNINSENDTVFFYLTSEEGPRLIQAPQNTQNPTLAQLSATSQSKASAHADVGILVNQLYEKYSGFCYAVAHAKPVGLRAFLTRLKELGTFMGFTVDGLQVCGLTMDKDKGVSLEKFV